MLVSILFMSLANGIAATVGSLSFSSSNESKKASMVATVDGGIEVSYLTVSKITPITAAIKGLFPFFGA